MRSWSNIVSTRLLRLRNAKVSLLSVFDVLPNLIRPKEFRKNAVKFGWELWEEKTAS